MTSDKDQDAGKQLNYAAHLKRVRQVGRTLDSISIQKFSSQQEPPSEREQVSHESIKDQAVSRKTRRPGGDYEVGKGLHPVEGNVEAQAASDAQNLPVEPAEQIPPAKPVEQTPQTRPPERTVAPTLLEVSANAPLDSLQKHKIVKNVAGAPLNKKPKASIEFVAKTLIDHNEIIRAQTLRQKARVEQEVSSRQQIQVKLIEPIKAQKEIRSCPFSWKDDSTNEGFKPCSKCQHTVYNFDGIEFSDAEKLIFKRENLKKFVLYKRPDGKFMTSDCPVAVKRKRQLIGIVAICICLIACLGGALMLMPPAPPPTANNSWSETAPDAVSTESHTTDAHSKSSSTKTGGTSQHYEVGDAIPTEPTVSGSNTNSQTQKNFSESEERGDFWEFQGQ